MKRMLGWLWAACLLTACGVGDGPPLGDFPALTKRQTEQPFVLAAPDSRSPAPFTFTSSNPAVATIDGATVTITGAGAATITAAQAGIGSYGPTRKTATLTVTPVTCVGPATIVKGECVAPAAAFLISGNLMWVAVTSADTWTDARDFCEGAVINSVAGWRQPTPAELTALAAARPFAGQGWALGATWSSASADAGQAAGHATVDLATGAAGTRDDAATAYVSCVR